MKIAVCLFGILYGEYLRYGHKFSKDFRHCWPNIKTNIIDSLKEHDVKIYVSTYFNESIDEEFKNLIKPNGVKYSEFEGSDIFTSKIGIFDALPEEDFDFVIATRLDLHFNKSIAELNLDYNKFNFLFCEKDHAYLKYTTDNFYAWPHRLTSIVKKSLQETYKAFRDIPDTHGLLNKLLQYVPEQDIHIVSNVEQFSDVNEFYTICKHELPDRGYLPHPEVVERYK
jgi:hypothetical protein